MRATVTALVFSLLALVCRVRRGEVERKAPIGLKDVPPDVMKVAKEKLPDVTFDRALKKANGEYEVIGKNKSGKSARSTSSRTAP